VGLVVEELVVQDHLDQIQLQEQSTLAVVAVVAVVVDHL
jgi:hypothetical protein